MTSNDWTMNDGVDKAPIGEIAEAVQANGYSAPLLSRCHKRSDSFVLAVGQFLDKNRNKVVTRQLVIESFPEDVGDDCIEVIVRVLDRLHILDSFFRDPNES